MDHNLRQTVDEIRARRIVLVDGENRPRLVMEVVTGGDMRNGGVRMAPRVTLLTERGKPILVLEIDTGGKPRVRVGNPDRGPVAELEAGLLLLGMNNGNTGALLIARDDGGVLHLCDEDGAPVVDLPSGVGRGGE